MQCDFLCGTVCEDGGSSKEIQTRVQAGAAVWRRVEGIMWDRKLKKQLKGKVLKACVVPACIYIRHLGITAQVCANKPHVFQSFATHQHTNCNGKFQATEHHMYCLVYS